jgi:hypothetical protein
MGSSVFDDLDALLDNITADIEEELVTTGADPSSHRTLRLGKEARPGK